MFGRGKETSGIKSDYLAHYSDSVSTHPRYKRPKSRSEILSRHARAEESLDTRAENAQRREQGLPVTRFEHVIFHVRKLLPKGR